MTEHADPGATLRELVTKSLRVTGDDPVLLAELMELVEADEDLTEAVAGLAVGDAYLVTRRGPNAPSRYLVDADDVLIGRAADADVFLDDQTVSRRHASIQRTDAGFVVEDLGSLNGTYINGERVERSMLGHLEELRIGAFVLVLIEGQQPADDRTSVEP